MIRTTAVATTRHQNGLRKNHRESENATSVTQYVLSFLILLLTAGITVGQEVLAALNFDANYLIITLIAIVVSLLAAHRKILYVLLIVGMSATINLPDVVLMDYGINKTILLLTLVAVITQPVASRFFK